MALVLFVNWGSLFFGHPHYISPVHQSQTLIVETHKVSELMKIYMIWTLDEKLKNKT